MSDDKDRVKESTDLVELVGSYSQLRRDGAGWKCCCPWHNDKKPSLTVNPSRQIWKCWVCDIGGDCFEWVMRQEGCGFRESLELLAERAGIVLGKLEGKRTQSRRTILDVMETVASKYQSSLDQDCMDYLSERSINQDSIEKWRLGTCVPFRALGVGEQLLVDAGVVGVSEASGRRYDRFSDRLIFPITDLQNRVVALGGRLVPAKKTISKSKYINSPETELFRKAKTLYGLRQARDGIRATKTAIVMEGYTDVIVAHQCGVDNTVACLGVAFSEDHAKQLSTIANRIVICLDGDEAGLSRSDAIAEMLVENTIDATIVTIPDKLDPADFILQRGAEAFNRVVLAGASPIFFKMNRICAGIDPRARSEKAAKALEAVLDLISRCDNPDMFVGAVVSMFQVRESMVLARLADRLRRKAVESTPKGNGISFTMNELVFFSLLINHPHESIPAMQERLDPNWLTTKMRHLWDAYESIEISGGALDFGSVMQNLQDGSIPKRLIESFVFHAEAVKVRGIALEPSTPIQCRVSDIIEALSKTVPKPIPYKDLF